MIADSFARFPATRAGARRPDLRRARVLEAMGARRELATAEDVDRFIADLRETVAAERPHAERLWALYRGADADRAGRIIARFAD